MPSGRRVARKAPPPRRSGGGGCCSCLFTLITMAIVAGLAVFLAVYLTGAESPADLIPEDFNPRDFIPSLEDFYEEDPFNATTPEEANRWRGTNGRGGLTLEIVNSLDPGWRPYFDQAVQEWDNGDPDVLTLSVSSGEVDSRCAAIRGKMRVCNGNYGDTRWKGINVVQLVRGEIIDSAAKMNEYYLEGAGAAQKQYTMCHEIGHGFGLPHTDENFNNRNTGECMDYTSKPSANKSPGPENFLFLEVMYGTVNNARRSWLRKLASASSSSATIMDPPTHVHHEMVRAVRQIEQRTDGQEHLDGWFEEHRSLHGSIHSRDFDGGYSIKVAKLLVGPNDL